LLGKRGVSKNPRKDFCARRRLGRRSGPQLKKGDTMAKIRDFVEVLDYEELKRLKEDLERGGMILSSLVKSRLEQKHSEHGRFCAVCFADIDPTNPNSFTLHFGSADFRKRASFCAADCLEYFISQLKLDSVEKI
jgi:hypothetical protein